MRARKLPSDTPVLQDSKLAHHGWDTQLEMASPEDFEAECGILLRSEESRRGLHSSPQHTYSVAHSRQEGLLQALSLRVDLSGTLGGRASR